MNKNRVTKFLSILLTMCMLLGMLPMTALADNFSDIKGHWAESQINEMINEGIVKGYPDGSFKPDGDISRAEFVSLIVKAFKLTKAKGKDFDDISNHWAKDAILTANAHGIVNGYSDTKFGPDDPITREQMAVIIVKVAHLTDNSKGKTFVDSQDISEWAKKAVAIASSNQLITGYPDNTFKPSGNASRAEATAVLSKSLTIVNLPVEIDYSSIENSGKYGPETGNEIIESDVIIKAKDVILQNLIIKGDLIISKEVGDGDATLNNVKVEGKTYIRGGGIDSIHINQGEYREIIIERTITGAVRILTANVQRISITISENDNGEDVILNGEIKTVTIKADGIKVISQGETTIDKIEVTRGLKDVKIELTEDTEVKEIILDSKVDVKGKGEIEKASGSKIRESTFVTAPKRIITPSTGGNGSSSSGGSGSGGTSTTPTIKVSAININKSTTTLVEGTTETLTVTFTPSNASNKTITWTTSDASKATIDSTGKVRAVSAGTATITAKSNNGKTATCVVTVTTTVVPVSAISITGDAVVGGTLTAVASGQPSITATYKWMRADAAAGPYSDIGGATAKTYVLTGDDLGKYIKVEVTGTGSYTGAKESVAKGPVSAPPVTYVVTVDGDAVETTDYTITGAADLSAVVEGTTLTVTAVTDITVNGDSVAAAGTKDIVINAATTITINKAVAPPATYAVTVDGDAAVDTDYTITGAADLSAVVEGTTLTVTAVTDITVNGDSVAAAGTKDIVINAATTITINKAVAPPATYAVTVDGDAAVDTDYTITGAADLSAVVEGTTLTVTAVTDITVNGDSVAAAGTKDIVINAATTITINKAVAPPATYAVTVDGDAAVDTDYTITGAADLSAVVEGTTLTVTAVTDITVNGDSVAAAGTKDIVINAATTITINKAVAPPATYAVTVDGDAAVDTDYTITGAADLSAVVEGTTLTVTAVTDITVNGDSVAAAGTKDIVINAATTITINKAVAPPATYAVTVDGDAAVDTDYTITGAADLSAVVEGTTLTVTAVTDITVNGDSVAAAGTKDIVINAATTITINKAVAPPATYAVTVDGDAAVDTDYTITGAADLSAVVEGTTLTVTAVTDITVNGDSVAAAGTKDIVINAATTITINKAVAPPATYAVTVDGDAAVDTDYTITGAADLSAVVEGTTLTVTAVTDITVNGDSVAAAGTKDIVINAATTITINKAVAPPATYAVTVDGDAAVDTDYTITGAADLSAVVEGTTLTVTAVTDITVNGDSVAAAGTKDIVINAATTITINKAVAPPATYAVTVDGDAAVDTDYTITGAADLSAVVEGTTLTVTAVTDITVNGDSVAAAGTKDIVINAATTITINKAVAPPATYAVTVDGDAAVDTDYTITGAADLSAVVEGTTLTVTAVTDITVNGDSVAAAGTKDIVINAATTITINKAVAPPATYAVTVDGDAAVDTDYTITGAADLSAVVEGTTLTVTAVTDITVNGDSVAAAGTKDIVINAATTITINKAVAPPATYAVTVDGDAAVDTDYTITGAADLSAVVEGTTLTVTAVTDITVNGDSVAAAGTKDIVINAATTITINKAVAPPATYAVTVDGDAAVDTDYTITGAADLSAVVEGTTLTVTAVTDITVNGDSVAAAGTKDIVINAATTITINKAVTHTLTFNEIDGGTISATVDGSPVSSGDSIENGKQVAITFAPEEYRFIYSAKLVVGESHNDIKNKITDNKHTFTISEDTEIVASFSAKKITVKGTTIPVEWLLDSYVSNLNWDDLTDTLIMDGYDGTYLSLVAGNISNVNIQLIGNDNKLTLTSGDKDAISFGDFTITGDGKDSSKLVIDVKGSMNRAIYDDVTIKNATVEINIDTEDGNNTIYGIAGKATVDNGHLSIVVNKDSTSNRQAYGVGNTLELLNGATADIAVTRATGTTRVNTIGYSPWITNATKAMSSPKFEASQGTSTNPFKITIYVPNSLATITGDNISVGDANKNHRKIYTDSNFVTEVNEDSWEVKLDSGFNTDKLIYVKSELGEEYFYEIQVYRMSE